MSQFYQLTAGDLLLRAWGLFCLGFAAGILCAGALSR